MSDEIIPEIERSVDDFTKRLKSPAMAIYTGDGLWVVSAHSRGIRVQGGDIMSVLREFEYKVRKYENTDALLAETLGLEAAE